MPLPSFRAKSRNLLYPKVSYRVETQRLQAGQETIRKKFPAEAAGNGFTSDRDIIILIAPVGCNLSTQSLAPRARGPMDAICPSAPQAQAPTGILESTVPIPTAPKALEPSNPIYAYKKTGTFCVGFLIAPLIVLISERKAARWQCRGRSRGGRFPGP